MRARLLTTRRAQRSNPINRRKNGDGTTHTLSGRELRTLRPLKRTYPNRPFVFVTERGGRVTEATVRKLLARAGTDR